MKKRTVQLFSTHGERIVARHYSKSNLITCGICGNQTPEELYLANDCPHCQMGIDYEVDSEGSDEKLVKLEKMLSIFE
jgi:hypothetical protein